MITRLITKEFNNRYEQLTNDTIKYIESIIEDEYSFDDINVILDCEEHTLSLIYLLDNVLVCDTDSESGVPLCCLSLYDLIYIAECIEETVNE
jgi:hypothetical protein